MVSIRPYWEIAKVYINTLLADPKRRKMLILGLVLFAVMLYFSPMFMGVAHAADPFQGFFSALNSWLSGSLGKALALIAFILGILAGAIFGKLELFFTAIIIALLIAFAPAIITSFF